MHCVGKSQGAFLENSKHYKANSYRRLLLDPDYDER